MRIEIKKIRVRPVIGVFDWEKSTRQDLLLTVKIDYDGTKAAKTDHIDDTLDYYTLTEDIIEKVEASRFELLEALAEFILDIIMERPLAQRAEIEIDKLAPLRKYAESVAVTAWRER